MMDVSGKPFTTTFKHHCFLTHNWGPAPHVNHLKVAFVNELLKQQGILTWFDSERMTGRIAQQMQDGIDRSMAIVIFITPEYIKKTATANLQDNCYLELAYACKERGGLLIPVIMDPGVRDAGTWKGLLKLHCLGQLYVDMTSDDYDELAAKALNLKDMIMAKAEGHPAALWPNAPDIPNAPGDPRGAFDRYKTAQQSTAIARDPGPDKLIAGKRLQQSSVYPEHAAGFSLDTCEASVKIPAEKQGAQPVKAIPIVMGNPAPPGQAFVHPPSMQTMYAQPAAPHNNYVQVADTNVCLDQDGLCGASIYFHTFMCCITSGYWCPFWCCSYHMWSEKNKKMSQTHGVMGV